MAALLAPLLAAFMTAVTLGPWSQAQADIFEELAAAPSAETITCEEALALSPTASVLVFTSAGSYLAGVRDWRYTDKTLERASDLAIKGCSEQPQRPLMKLLEDLADP